MTDEQARSPTGKELSASFVVPFWAAVFAGLSYVSIFKLVKLCLPRGFLQKYGSAVVEAWVICHTAVAAVSAILAYYSGDDLLVRGLLLYGGLRILEITVYQANVLLFDAWRARRQNRPYELRGYRRIVLLLLHNYAEMVFWFMAVLIFLNQAARLDVADPSLVEMFRVSVLMMVTFSVENVRPRDLYAATILATQSIVGVFMTLLTLARFVSLIPDPDSADPTD